MQHNAPYGSWVAFVNAVHDLKDGNLEAPLNLWGTKR